MCKIFEAKDYKTIENYEKCVEHFLLNDSISANLLKRVEAKYKNYIEKQKNQIDHMKEMIDIKIPALMDFGSISGLSNEVVEKLQRFSPPTLFAASEISGITPAALDILHIYIKIFNKK